MALTCTEWIKLNIRAYGWILNFLLNLTLIIYFIRLILGPVYSIKQKIIFLLMFGKKTCLQLILPFFDYADVVYQNTTKTNLFPLTTAYYKLCRFVIGCSYDTHHCIMYDLLK